MGGLSRKKLGAHPLSPWTIGVFWADGILLTQHRYALTQNSCLQVFEKLCYATIEGVGGSLSTFSASGTIAPKRAPAASATSSALFFTVSKYSRVPSPLSLYGRFHHVQDVEHTICHT